MVGHGGSSAGSYLAVANPTSPIPSHCASIVTTSTLRVKKRAVSFVIADDHFNLPGRGRQGSMNVIYHP